MKIRCMLVSFVTGSGLTLVLLWLLSGAGAPATAALSDITPVHYVAVTGTNGGDCSTPVSACLTIQYAVDQAGDGDEIRVAAGIYMGVISRPTPSEYYDSILNPPVLTQVVYISKTLAVQGGYTTANGFAGPPDPRANPTTLDAQGQGRVLCIIGDITTTIEGLRITGGDADGLRGASWSGVGGGVYAAKATVTVSGSQVFSNVAEAGGGVYMREGSAILRGNTVSSNTVSGFEAMGGGMCLESVTATLANNAVATNTADAGGGLYVVDGAVALIDNTVSRNGGGGLYLDWSDILLDGNTISGNSESGFEVKGGGIYLGSSTARVGGNTIVSNTATGSHAGYGGGLYAFLSTAVLTNNVVADNRSSTAGSGVYIEGSSAWLLHNTIARNTGGDGSGICVTEYPWDPRYSSVLLTNTILVSHTVGISIAAGNTATLEATLWGSGAWANEHDWQGTGSITYTRDVTGTPAFLAPEAGNYHIGLGSAAIDRGVNTGVSSDIDGDQRPLGLFPDLGADEVQSPVYHYCLAMILRNHQ